MNIKNGKENRTISLMFLLFGVILIGCNNNQEKITGSENIIDRPYSENMSENDFKNVLEDTIVFTSGIGESFSCMADLSIKYSDVINSSDTFDWAQYWDFRENKEKTVQLCDEILSYDDECCNLEFQFCIDEIKSMAYQTKSFMEYVSQERTISELNLYTQILNNAIVIGMNNACVYQTKATISYLETNNGDTKTISELKKQLEDNYLYNISNGIIVDIDDCKQNFSNCYGTLETECMHNGCHNTIALFGDTCNCIVHSNKCLNCGKYIDEDAIFCMECLTGAISGWEEKINYLEAYNMINGCQFIYFDGTVCGAPTNKYACLCDLHFDFLNDVYQDMVESSIYEK